MPLAAKFTLALKSIDATTSPKSKSLVYYSSERASPVVGRQDMRRDSKGCRT